MVEQEYGDAFQPRSEDLRETNDSHFIWKAELAWGRVLESIWNSTWDTLASNKSLNVGRDGQSLSAA